MMKSTGITRKIDDLGRIVLPKELREAQGLDTGTRMEIFTEGDSVILRKYQAVGSCDFCGEVGAGTVQFQGKYVCAACRRALARL